MRQFSLHRHKTHFAARASRALLAIPSAIFALACAPLILVMLVAQPARAQGSRKDDIIFNAQGRPMAGATVRVCTVSATGQPCTPLANIYSDEAMTQALANPLTTDGLGNYTFYAAPGRYEIEISGPGITDKQLPNVILPNDPNNPTFTSLTTDSGLTMFSLSLSGNLTVNGSTAVNGTLTVGGAPVPSTNQQNTWTASQQFVGPTPWIDMTAFPTTPACPWVFNGIPMVTISSGALTTATATFADADYAVGCSVYIPGAGPNSSLAAPTAGAVVNHDGSGSTTYKYEVVAVDANNGYGPASAQFQTTTGFASLNKWQYNLLQWTAPSGTVKEYVIYGDEGTGGALVKLGTSYFPTFEDTGFYGANMQPSPSFLPANPPTAAGPQGLFTTIAAVSGTTLTLANAASAPVSGTYIYLDNKNALASAISAWCNAAGGAQLQIGSGRWMLTSWPVPCGRGEANVKLLGDLAMVDGPLVMPESLQIYGVGSLNNSQPFGNTLTGQIDSVADYGFGGDQLGTVILGSQFNVLNGISGNNFQGDYIEYGDTGIDDLRVLATAATHSGGCVVHFLSQIITMSIDGGSVLVASGDAGGKAAICFDTQFVGGGASTAFANITIGTATGQNLNWQNHFISFACPICTAIRSEINLQFNNTYGESLLEPAAIAVDPGQGISPYGIDALYGFIATNMGNDNNDFAGPCFGVLNPPNREGGQIITGAVQTLGCGVGTVSGIFTGAVGGMFTPSGTPDFSVAAPVSLSGFNANKIAFNQYGFAGAGQVYGLDGSNALLPPNTGVSLFPGGFEGGSYYECVECWLIPAPSSLSVSVTHSAGTLAAGVHCYAVSANDKQSTPGNSLLSNEVCVTNVLNDENILSYSNTGDAGIGGITVWRGSSSGSENVYLGASQPTTTNLSSFTDTGSVATTSATPANQGSAYETMLYNTHGTGYLHGNAINDGLHFGFGCPPSGTYVWETCGNTGFDNNVTITGSLTAGGRTNFFSAGGRIALTDAATIAFNVAGLPNPWGTVTLGGNRNLSVTNMLAGGNYILSITQDGTGSRTLTLGTGGTGGCSHWYVSGGGGGAITLTTAASATDLLGWKYDGTNCWAILNTNFN